MAWQLKIWTCKIGEAFDHDLAAGADSPMRRAVAEAYEQITGQKPWFIFSGWGGELSVAERAAYENREPFDQEIEAEIAILEGQAEMLRNELKRRREK